MRNSYDAPFSIITRDLEALAAPTGNLYEALIVVSKRSKQISTKLKEELNAKLEDFAVPTDALTEVYENQEQVEISRYYEHLPKPTSIAISEFMSQKLHHRRYNPQQATSPDAQAIDINEPPSTQEPS